VYRTQSMQVPTCVAQRHFLIDFPQQCVFHDSHSSKVRCHESTITYCAPIGVVCLCGNVHKWLGGPRKSPTGGRGPLAYRRASLRFISMNFAIEGSTTPH
jgi:hypothetical protein